MSSIRRHSTNPTKAVLEDLQPMRRRLAIRLGAIWLITLLVIGAALFFMAPLDPIGGWLLFGGGLLGGSIGAFWFVDNLLKTIPAQPLPTLEAEVQPVVSPRVRTDLSLPEAKSAQRVPPPPVEQQPPSDLNKHRLFVTTAASTPKTIEPAWSQTDLAQLEDSFMQQTQLQVEGIAVHKKINILAADHAFATLFNYEIDEIVGKTLLQLSAQESQGIVLKNILAKMETPYEAIGLTKDGSMVPIELLSRSIIYKGQSVRVLGIRQVSEREVADVLWGLQKTNQALESQVKANTTELRYANERLRQELEERERIEERLRLSDQVISRINNLILVSDNQGEITYVSPSVYRMLGYSPEEVLGNVWLQLTRRDEADRDREKAYLLGAANGTVKIESLPYERQIYDKEGNPHWLLWHDTKGPDDLIIGVGSDITERKLAEAEIIQRNRELTILQSAGAAITSSLDLRYVLDTVTQEMTKLLEIEACAISEWDEVENVIFRIAKYGPSGWWDYTAEATIYDLAHYPLTKEVLEQQMPTQMTVSQPNIDPSELGYMREAGLKTLMMIPMIFQKQVVGLIELEDGRDERTFTQQEISLVQLLANQAASAIENARLYHEIQQHVAELTILNEISHTITSTLDLQKMLEIINNHITQLLGVAATSVVLYDDRQNELWFAAASGAGADFMRDRRLALKEGVVSWVVQQGEPVMIPDVSKDPRFFSDFDQQSKFKTRSILCVPLKTKGKVIGAIEAMNKLEGTFDEEDLRILSSLAAPAAAAIDNAQLFEQAQQEITERQRAEAALSEERALLAQRVKERTAELSKANAELARAARLKDEFLANMSHELRTPLNAILGSSEILQTGVFGEVNERQLKYLRNTEESGRHLLALINDILDLSKIEAGKFELEIRPASVESTCEASLRLVKQLAHKKRLKVIKTVDKAVVTLPADERRLKQILVNLLSNAIKFTPDSGEIGLEVVGDVARHVVHFTVWDSGIGIAAEDLPQLFQPFVQADSSISKHYQGTGLGLSLVSRMTELHGGSVSVESEVNVGSRFTVTLPWPEAAEAEDLANQATIEQKPDAVAAPRPAEQALILMAEDNEDNITTLLDYLEAHGFQIVVARNGLEAIERATEEKPDLILMDIQMPEMDGLEATRRIRSDATLRDVPIFALTALAMPGDRERCLEAGANEYLSKPVSPRQLVNTITTYLA